MDTANTNTNDKAKAKNGDELGISKGIYAAGYAVKDSFVWFGVLFVGLFATLTFGKNLAPVRWGQKQLKELKIMPWVKGIIKDALGEKAAKWVGKIEESVKGPVIAVSAGTAWLLSHIAIGPGLAYGRAKASTAINKYNTLSEERDQLVTTNNVLKEDNDRLNAALAEMKNNRPSLAERTAQSSQAGLTTSLQ